MIRTSAFHIEKIIGLFLLFLITILFISSSLFASLMLVLFLAAITGYLVRSYGLIIFSQEPSPVPDNAAEGNIPTMSVMIPLHNEELVIAETMRKMVSLDYLDRNITIVFVLDNCTDSTEAVLDEAARELRFSPMDSRFVESATITRTKRYQNPVGRTIDLIIRDANIGGKGKAAALNAAFGTNNADIIGFYDADHRPDPGNAKRAVRWLSGNKNLGCVQGSCYIMNGSTNILTGLVFFEYAALNRVEQPAKSVYDGMVCFEGANGFFRREAIEKGGGFDPDNLAEDTYFSFKLADLGYRIAFDPEIRSCEQCPENLKSWYQQRLRWARGWFQCTGHNLFRVGHLNLLQRCEGEYLLLSGLQSILIMFFLLLYPLTILYYALLNLAGVSENIPFYQYNPFFSLGFIIPFFYALAIITPILQVTVGAALLADELPGFMRKNRKNVVVLFLFPVYSVMHGLVALFAFVDQFILKRPGIWVKTPRSRADSIEFAEKTTG